MIKSIVFAVSVVVFSANLARSEDCIPPNNHPTKKQLYQAITCLQKAIQTTNPTPTPAPSPALPATLGNVEIHTASGGQNLCLRYDYTNSHVAVLGVTDCRPQNPNQTNTKWNIELR